MKTSLTLLIITLLSLNVFSQTDADLDSLPALHHLNSNQLKEQAIYIFDNRIADYGYNFGDYSCKYTHHYTVHVNSSDALDQFNKVYLPMSGVNNLISFKVRAISSAGVVTLMSDSNIKDIDNYEQSGPYKICAVDGLDAGGEVEVLISYTFSPSFCDNEILQAQFNKLNVNFTILSPRNIIYKTKSYNGISEMIFDSLTEKNAWRFHADSLSGLPKEQYSNRSANLARIEYMKLYNLTNGAYPIFSFHSVAENYYNSIHDFSATDIKNVSSLLKQIKANTSDKTAIIFLIDDFLKTNFTHQEIDNPVFSSISKVMQNKVANEIGLCKLYTILLNDFNIKSEIVLTCDRTESKFDDSFETLNYLDHTLIYCPEQKVFIDPDDPYSRLGLIPSEYLANHGLFIYAKTIGNYTTGLSRVDLVPENNAAKSVDSINIQLQIDAGDLNEVHATVHRSVTGYQASFQSYFYLMDLADQNNLTSEYLKLMGADSKLSHVAVQNIPYSQNQNHPFMMNADVVTSSLIEQAGEQFLFKLGETIGEQSELYSDNQRQSAIDNDFNRGYVRTIQFNIPEGYTLSNPNDMNMDVKFVKQDSTICFFKSTYEIENNMVTVYVNEFYNEINLPVTDYELFRSVINAAADFNKIKIVFSKQN